VREAGGADPLTFSAGDCIAKLLQALGANLLVLNPFAGELLGVAGRVY
jgi:hypothetical protein